MSRTLLLRTYRDNMAQYVAKKYSIPYDKADALVHQICIENYKPKTAIVVENEIDGEPKIVARDLCQFFDSHVGDIIAPSGAVYMQHEKKLGMTIDMVMSKLAKRSKLKKEMLKCKATGDSTREMQCYYGQTLIKIGINSLPGAYGSAYSIFYSKFNYNAITSSARALIMYSYATAEAVLGGNFAWFSEEDLINHFVIHIPYIDTAKIRQVLYKHNLKWVSKVDLLQFYMHELNMYHKTTDIPIVRSMLETMSEEEIQYFWYFQNLRHVFWENEDKFKPWFQELFDLSKIKYDENANPQDLFKLDDCLVNLVSVSFAPIFNTGDASIQTYDYPDKRPDLAKKFVSIANHVQEAFNSLQDIFDTFIYTPINRPSVQTRKDMLRNTAVVSDTDSVIFTVKDWVQWYTGDVYKITPAMYHISCCAIYWLTKAVAHTLLLYSRSIGAKGKFETTMKMKNEFLYPTMILADVKKHYAGVVTVQEGVILPKPDIDIKGVQFKGSDICKAATKFAENFIVKDILNKSTEGRISASDLIKKVVNFENKIREEINNGGVDWYKMLAIRVKKYYDVPLSSNYLYYLAWQEIFSSKYGEFQVPTKAPVVPIAKPTDQYFEWLESIDRSIVKKFTTFLERYGKTPTYIATNPTNNTVPKELVPLIDIRAIIYHNIKPCYIIMKQLGIDIGFEKDKILFSDLYKINEK